MELAAGGASIHSGVYDVHNLSHKKQNMSLNLAVVLVYTMLQDVKVSRSMNHEVYPKAPDPLVAISCRIEKVMEVVFATRTGPCMSKDRETGNHLCDKNSMQSATSPELITD